MKRSLAALILAAMGVLLPSAERAVAAQVIREVKASPQAQASSAASAHDRHHRRHSTNRHHHHHHRSSAKH